MKTLWQHCHVATMAQGVYSIIEDAAIVTSGALIEWIGPRDQLPSGEYPDVNDLQGAWVTPGLIDCHTHTVFGGNRSGEFENACKASATPKSPHRVAVSPAPCAPLAKRLKTSCSPAPPNA